MWFNFWRKWMSKTQVTIQVEKELRKRIDEAVASEGTTLSAWVRKTLLAALMPLPVDNASVANGVLAKKAMDAAFDSLDAPGAGNDYPGVMPMPPGANVLMEQPALPVPVAAAPQPNMEPRGHACAHFRAGRTAAFTMSQIGGTCALKDPGGGVACHFASHMAKECTMYRAMRAQIPPMASVR
jgi:hypothetical protein